MFIVFYLNSKTVIMINENVSCLKAEKPADGQEFVNGFNYLLLNLLSNSFSISINSFESLFAANFNMFSGISL